MHPALLAACGVAYEDAMDLSRWKKRSVKVSALELDPLNPRIPTTADSLSQRDIVEHLIEHEDIFELAKSIADFGGLYPSELLIAVEVEGKKIVVEGNRRLAALKLLHSPEIAPENRRSKFRSLVPNVTAAAIEKVEVVMVPSRAAAARLIVARHTGDVVKRWSRAQQAKYIRTLVQGDQSIEDVAAQVQMTAGEIRNFLRTDTMIQVAHEAAPSLREKIDNKAFSVTTLERIIQSDVGKKFLGIKFDDDGNVNGEYDPEGFKKVFSRIVSDIADETINTRALNTNEDMRKYFGKFDLGKPKKASWTSIQMLSQKAQGSVETLKTAKKVKPAEPMERVEPYLIPKAFRCRITQPRIREIYTELRRLKLGEFPNACAVLGRIFVELLVGHYLEKTGKDKRLLDKAKSEGKKDDWSPTLRQMMREILNDKSITMKPQVKRALERLTNDDASLVSLEHIDQFVHNRYIAPSERVLRQFWTAFEPLLEGLIAELVELSAAKSKP